MQFHSKPCSPTAPVSLGQFLRAFKLKVASTASPSSDFCSILTTLTHLTMPCVILEAPADLFEKGCQDVHPDFKAVIPHHGPWPFDLLVRIAKNPTVGINNCIEVRDSCEARGPGFIVSTVERRDGQGQGEPIVSQMTLGFQQIKLFPKSLLKKIHEALMTKSPIRNGRLEIWERALADPTVSADCFQIRRAKPDFCHRPNH